MLGESKKYYLESLSTYDGGYAYTNRPGTWRNLFESSSEQEESIRALRMVYLVCSLLPLVLA